MQARIYIPVMTFFVALSWVTGTWGETIRIENGGTDDFRYSYRGVEDRAWSKSFELAPQQTHVLTISGPITISYWTDKPRFATLQPDRTYRIADVRRGELMPVTTVLKPSSEARPAAPTGSSKTDASSPARGPRDAGKEKPDAQAAEVRIIRVRAVADATYRRVVDNWRQRIQNAVSGASEYFESNFRIRFVLEDVQPWEYRGVTHDTRARLKSLLALSPETADLVVGFIGFGEYLKADANAYFTGLLGMGMPFGQHVMVSGDDHYHPNRDKFVLIHELAHVFGAFHVMNCRSLMYPASDGVPAELVMEGTFELEPALREVILAARNIDLQRGADSLPRETRRRIEALCREHRHPRESRAPTLTAYSYVLRELREYACGNAGRPADAPEDVTGGTPNANDVLQPGEKVRVTAESTPLRVGNAPLFDLGFGELLEVAEQQGQWVHVIARDSGLRGWVQKKQLQEAPLEWTAQPGQVRMTNVETEVRAGEHLLAILPPGIHYQVQRVETDRVEISTAKQEVATFPGAKLVFEPTLEGWVWRDHLARSRTADIELR